MSNHTPGPWVVVENPDAENGSNAASIYSDNKKTDLYIADVYRGYVGCEHVKPNEQLSNARLIAAAPELLEALTHIIMAIGYTSPDPEVEQAILEGFLALERANGGAKGNPATKQGRKEMAKQKFINDANESLIRKAKGENG